MLPVVNGSPVGWENLYNANKAADKLREIIYPEGKQSSLLICNCTSNRFKQYIGWVNNMWFSLHWKYWEKWLMEVVYLKIFICVYLEELKLCGFWYRHVTRIFPRQGRISKNRTHYHGEATRICGTASVIRIRFFYTV